MNGVRQCLHNIDRLIMAKNTMGTKLPRKLGQKMQIVGEQIKLARLRRNQSVAQVAECATCSPLTVSRIEQGVPTSDQVKSNEITKKTDKYEIQKKSIRLFLTTTDK